MIKTEQEPKVLAKESSSMPPFDYFGHIHDSLNGTSRGALYYYLIEGDRISQDVSSENAYNTIVVPPTSAVISVSQHPYLSADNLDFKGYDYDYKRFKIKGMTDDNDDKPIGKMYRINNLKNYSTVVGTFKPFPQKRANENRDWRNESKLFQFPFSYGLLNDNISEPLEVKYELCESKTTANVKIQHSLNDSGTYGIYVEGYNGDMFGDLQTSINTMPMQIPTVSSVYTDYMSTSKNAHRIGQASSILGGVAGVIGSVALAPVTMGASLIGTGITVASSVTDVLGSFAKEKDMKKAPLTVTNRSTDSLYKMDKSTSLKLYRMTLREEQLRMLGDFFAMYGYTVNKLDKPNIRSRRDYNFIKTNGVNFQSNGIPSNHLQKLKSIFDNGVTVWHVDRNGGKICDYSKDNIEV